MEPLSVRRRTVAADVLTQLREAILAGRWSPGSPLRQDALAAELGVSRIPVREAMMQLEAEGLLVSEPHRGAFVAPLGVDDVVELFELRASIEPVLALRAVPRLTPSDLEAADQARLAFDAALEAGDVASWSRLNWAFHEALYRPARRSRSLRMAQELARNAERGMRAQLALSGAVTKAGRDHAVILDAARAGKADRVADLICRHVTEAGHDLARHLQSGAVASADVA